MQAQFSLMFSGEAIHLAKAVYVKMLNSTAKSIVYKRRAQRITVPPTRFQVMHISILHV